MSALEPTGVGVYLRYLSKQRHGEPHVAAQHAADAGVSFVALLSVWQDKGGKHRRVNSTKRLAEYSQAFIERGIDVWIWGYPWGTRKQVEQFVSHVRPVLDATGATGYLLDPELGFKGNAKHVHAARLMRGVLDSLGEAHGVGVTSYPAPRIHRTFAWRAFGGLGWGGPQCYTVPFPLARAGMAHWHRGEGPSQLTAQPVFAGWPHLVPSVPTFGPNSSERTAAYASTIAAIAGELTDRKPGIMFWSWRSTSTLEWRAIEAVAEQLRDV